MQVYNSCVNFLTCHDGFTMYDLYSYNEKHNEANGWNNTDGSNDNRSWNCGEEGESTNPVSTFPAFPHDPKCLRSADVKPRNTDVPCR